MKTFNLLSVILGSLITISSSWLLENLFILICTSDPPLLGQAISNKGALDFPILFYVVNIFSTACICFLGGTIPVLIGSGNLKFCILIGGVSTLYALANSMMSSFPIWYKVIYTLAFCPFCCCGTITINVFNEKVHQKCLIEDFERFDDTKSIFRFLEDDS